MNKIILLIILAVSINTYSQEIEPRNYASVPTGLNIVAFSYSLANGNVVSDPAAPIQDLSVTSHSAVLGYVRSFGLFGKLARIQAGVPFVYMLGDANFKGVNTNGNRTGFADVRVRFGVNLFGSPALAPKEFQRYKEETIFGLSMVVTAPTGQYFNDKMVNLGSNRWGFKPEIGFSQRYKNIYFETFAGLWLFTTNNDFYNGNVLKQNPLYSFQAHLNYYFPSRMMVAINGAYVNGGNSSVNDKEKDDLQNNVRLGATFLAPVGKGHIIKALFNTGILTKNGGGYSIFTIGYQYIWI
jgi:hypothetical protein